MLKETLQGRALRGNEGRKKYNCFTREKENPNALTDTRVDKGTGKQFSAALGIW